MNVGWLAKCKGTRLVVVAYRDLGENWSMILEIKNGHRCIHTVVSQTICNPMYAYFLIGGLAQGFVLANVRVLVFGITAWKRLSFLWVPKEEELLIAEFGDEYWVYENYRAGHFKRFHRFS